MPDRTRVQKETYSQLKDRVLVKGKEFSIVDDLLVVREFDSNEQFHLDDWRSPG